MEFQRQFRQHPTRGNRMITSKLTCLLHSCYVKHIVSYFLCILFFISFTETYDLATLVDNTTHLPASLPSHVTLSLPKTPPNFYIPISAHHDTEFMSGKAYTNVITVPLGSISDLPLVEFGTTLTIIICFFWLARVSWNTSMRLDRHHLKSE